jgi:hypothetical protein
VSEKQKSLSLCLLRLDEAGHLEEIYNTCRSIAGVISCDPVRNRYQLVVKYEGERNVQEIFREKLQNNLEIQRMDFLTADLSKSYLNTALLNDGNKEAISSYILFEAEANKLSGIMDGLRNISLISGCYPTSGLYNLIAEMKGPSFFKLHRTLTGDIRPLDGIRRCWMLNVINIQQI